MKRYFCAVFVIALGFATVGALAVWISPSHHNPLAVLLFGSLAIASVVGGTVLALANGGREHACHPYGGDDAEGD